MTPPLSYWLDTPYTPRPALKQNVEADVAIIGGGIGGISTAYHCAKQGMKTVLVEKDIVAFGAAGRNGGMVVEGFSIDFLQMASQFGIETAKESWLRTVAARQTVQSLIKEENIDCGLEQPGSLYLSTTPDETDWLRKEAAARQEAGIACELVEPGTQLRHSPFGVAIYNPSDCALDPVKFIRSLALAAERYNAVIYDKTPATQFDSHTITTPAAIIKADKVVLAMETTAPEITEGKGQLMRLQAIMTQPLTEKQFESLDWPIGGMLWNSGPDYYTIRKLGRRLFVSYNVSLDADEAQLKQNEQNLVGSVLKSFPDFRREDILVSHSWNCMMLDTKSKRPYISNKDGCYMICGYEGNGLTNGIMAGQLLARSFTGTEIPALYEFEV